MVIYQDTRQQKGKHTNIEKYLLSKGVEIVNKKLDVGDYMTPDNPFVTIDTKCGLDELAKNLTNPKDHARFMREVRRAKEQHLKLIILCECSKIKQIQDVTGWKSKHSPVPGRVLMERIYQTHISYGVEFLFCDKRNTAKKILELLYNLK